MSIFAMIAKAIRSGNYGENFACFITISMLKSSAVLKS